MCDKKPYSKKLAQTVLNRLIDEGRWNKKEDYGRIYPCHCGAWHITSLDNKNTFGGKERPLILKHKFIHLLNRK